MQQLTSMRHPLGRQALGLGVKVLRSCGSAGHARQVQVHSTPTAGGSSLGSLSVLTNTRPVDRLRFQAVLVFKHFDSDGDGKLTLEQLDQYAAYSAERFGPVAAQLQPLYDNLRTSATGSFIDMESFIDLVREQIKVASAHQAFPRSIFNDTELRKYTWDSALAPAALAAALAIFRLLDFNNDNYLKLEDLRKAQGIEREIVDDKLEDADTNEDGFLSFKDFLTSYARERPVILNMLVLLAHTAAFWVVLNLPMLEIPFKAVLCVGLMLKPQIVTGPVIKLFTIIRTVIDRARAEVEMAGQRGGGATA